MGTAGTRPELFPLPNNSPSPPKDPEREKINQRRNNSPPPLKAPDLKKWNKTVCPNNPRRGLKRGRRGKTNFNFKAGLGVIREYLQHSEFPGNLGMDSGGISWRFRFPGSMGAVKDTFVLDPGGIGLQEVPA